MDLMREPGCILLGLGADRFLPTLKGSCTSGSTGLRAIASPGGGGSVAQRLAAPRMRNEGRGTRDEE